MTGEPLRERVLAIVNLITQYFLEEHEPKSESDLVEELLAVGFDADEIDAAFSWMEDQTLRPPRQEDGLTAPVLSHRVFSPEEPRILCGEARGFLVRLRSLGILDEELFEEIIHKSVEMSDEEVSFREIKTIAILALFARSQHQWRHEFDCLLEDDWSRLLN
jgi:Smg protein